QRGIDLGAALRQGRPGDMVGEARTRQEQRARLAEFDGIEIVDRPGDRAEGHDQPMPRGGAETLAQRVPADGVEDYGGTQAVCRVQYGLGKAVIAGDVMRAAAADGVALVLPAGRGDDARARAG